MKGSSMYYKLRVIDVDSGKIVGAVDGPNPMGAFDVGDHYVQDNPDKDYLVVDENTGAYVTRNDVVDRDEEIRRFAEAEVGGNY
jgi:hypothetical protein